MKVLKKKKMKVLEIKMSYTNFQILDIFDKTVEQFSQLKGLVPVFLFIKLDSCHVL